MDSDEKYLVRIDGYHNLINKNIIIDYSYKINDLSLYFLL